MCCAPYAFPRTPEVRAILGCDCCFLPQSFIHSQIVFRSTDAGSTQRSPPDVSPWRQVFERVAALVAELDVLQSFAELSVSAPTPYVRPSISGPVSLPTVPASCTAMDRRTGALWSSSNTWLRMHVVCHECRTVRTAMHARRL